MPDPKIIGLLAMVSLLVGYGALSIGMDQIKEDYDSNSRLSDLLRPSVFPRRAMYEIPREWKNGGKKYSKRVWTNKKNK